MGQVAKKKFLVLQQNTTSDKHSKSDIIMNLHKNSTHTKVNPNIHMRSDNTIQLACVVEVCMLNDNLISYNYLNVDCTKIYCDDIFVFEILDILNYELHVSQWFYKEK